MKGDCYSAAYWAAREAEPDEGELVWVVHGYVTTPKVGRIAHAWVEIESGKNWVLDTSNDQSYLSDKKKYYKLVKAEMVVRYTVEEAIGHFLRSQHYGPWHEG